MLWFAIGAPGWVTLAAYVIGLLAGAVMLYDISETPVDVFPGGREGKLVWIVLFVFSFGLGLQPLVPIAYWFGVYRKKETPDLD